MARPQKDGMDYFPHDTDALSDEKVEALRSIYGNDGYAFYFVLLERIYRTPQAELDISDAETKQILARKVAVTLEKFEQMLATALKWGCFDKQAYEERGALTSNGIKKRANVVTEKRLKMRNQYRKQVSDAETIAETPQSKVKESKEKKSKEKQEEELGENDIQQEQEIASSGEPPLKLNPDFGQAYRMFEQELGRPLSPLEVETVKELFDNYGLDLLREAMRRAIAQGKRNMRYIRAILESWRGENLKTIAEVLEYEQKRERKRNNGPQRQAGGREPPNFEKSTNLKEKYKDIYL